VCADSGDFIVICWNADHARSRGAHPFKVPGSGAREDKPPPDMA